MHHRGQPERECDLSTRSVDGAKFRSSYVVTQQQRAASRLGLCAPLAGLGWGGVAAAATSVTYQLFLELDVATIPLSAFYSDGTDHGLIRLSFVADEAPLVEGARRLYAL